MNTEGNKAAKKAATGNRPAASKIGTPLKVTWVDSVMDAEDTAGAAKWVDMGDPDRPVLNYVCPCGCRDIRTLPVKTGDKINGRWFWDGNREAPTFKPSIRHLAHAPDECSWHGYMTNGEWVTV